MKKTIISGTYLDRFLYNTLPTAFIFIFALYLVETFISRATVNPYFAVFVSLAYIILRIITDVVSMSIRKIKILSIDDTIYFNAMAVQPTDIVSIERKRVGYRPVLNVIEFGVMVGDVVTFYLVLEKPQWLLNKQAANSKTLELLFERFPQLKNKLVTS
ncbi:MAG TPA: hypothetical protein VG738_21625 [Chitinophagaceae bacterium]|nr:hypothetical protein [Chitinophagaceae bacterium]